MRSNEARRYVQSEAVGSLLVETRLARVADATVQSGNQSANARIQIRVGKRSGSCHRQARRESQMWVGMIRTGIRAIESRGREG